MSETVDAINSDPTPANENNLIAEQIAYLQQRRKRLISSSRFNSPNLKNISNTLKTFMPNEYEANEKELVSAEIKRPGITRHKNSRAFERGGARLKIDVAGSGFKSFRSDHIGIKGKGKVIDENGQEISTKKQKVKWYNKVFGGWVKFIMSREQIEEENIKRAQAKTRFKQRFGEKVTYDHSKMKHVHKIDKGNNTTKISMAGPLALGGALNIGAYSIENLRKYIFESGKAFIEDQITKHKEAENIKDNLVIELRGHSRGSVASIEGGMMLKYWLNENHPELLSKVKFSLLQNDPVPGLGSMTGHESFDHASEVPLKTSDGVGMLPLGKDADTTVVYSMHTEYKFGFTPQKVDGAKRVILTPLTHKVGLGDVDEQDLRREGFVYKGQSYGHRSLNDLPEGVYIMDEENNLMRFDGSAQAKKVLDATMPDTFTQKERHQILKDVVKSWFENNPEHDNDLMEAAPPPQVKNHDGVSL